ncbi:MAG: hypothetical protein V9F04_18120, partial [Dermatophilaceae bacterium]
ASSLNRFAGLQLVLHHDPDDPKHGSADHDQDRPRAPPVHATAGPQRGRRQRPSPAEPDAKESRRPRLTG